MSDLAFVQRFRLAWRVFFRVLFQDADASELLLDQGGGGGPGELANAGGSGRTVGAKAKDTSEAAEVSSARVPQVQPASEPGAEQGVLQLLNLMQREGRFIDFVQQDIDSFSDAQIGQAARVVHAGCRATLKKYMRVEPVMDGQEGERATVPVGFDAAAVKLVGEVSGEAPFHGVLRHKGWRARAVQLPETLKGHAHHILAQAEVEL